jgi:predicted MFS family arabinose efflux permease
MAAMTEHTPSRALPGDEAQRVTVSAIVRLRGGARFPLQSWRQTRRLALVLPLGLAAIMLAFHFLDPQAPAAYIVLPVLAGGLLPLMLPPTGRFEVATHDARALAGTLDETLAALGYVREGAAAGVIRYRVRAPGGARPVAVTIGERGLAITGPVAVLEGLHQHLAS